VGIIPSPTGWLKVLRAEFVLSHADTKGAYSLGMRGTEEPPGIMAARQSQPPMTPHTTHTYTHTYTHIDTNTHTIPHTHNTPPSDTHHTHTHHTHT
jgi:hypothetical protein